MELPTFPSAHSNMSSKGRSARYMVVVFHHMGRPKRRTISQKERMTWLRRRTSDAFSGGGSFLDEVGASCLGAIVAMETSLSLLGSG